MKLKFERYPGISCFFIRGVIDAAKFRILKIGLDTLIAQQEEDIILHLGLARIAPVELAILLEYKKNLAKRSPFPLHWISKEKGLGDFVTLELAASRMLTNKLRQVGLKIKLDDQVHELSEEQLSLDEKIKSLGGDAENAMKILQENERLKSEQQILTQCNAWHGLRIQNQKVVLSDDEELPNKLATLKTDLEKALGGDYGL